MELENNVNKECQKDIVNKSFGLVSISPLKSHSIHKRTLVNEARTKFKRGFELQKELVNNVLEIDDPAVLSSQGERNSTESRKLWPFDVLTERIKIPVIEKLQFLKMTPSAWSRAEAAKFFQVSEYFANKSRVWAKEKGVMALLNPKKGHCLS